MLKDYKDEGREAFEDGKGYEQNPYPARTIAHDLWFDGYFEADIEASGDIG